MHALDVPKHRTLASRPINNKNGAKKVYVRYNVFPKCENHEFTERCFSVMKNDEFCTANLPI